MEELVRTNDIVLLNVLGVMLDDAGIRHLMLDENMSVVEGSLGVLPRRVLVAKDRRADADAILAELRAERAKDLPVG